MKILNTKSKNIEWSLWSRQISSVEPINITLLSPRTHRNHWFRCERNNLEDEILAWQRKRRNWTARKKCRPDDEALREECEINARTSPHIEWFSWGLYFIYVSLFFFCLGFLLLRLLLFRFCLSSLLKIPSYPFLSVSNTLYDIILLGYCIEAV